MLEFKYETHAHTSGISRCGKIDPRDLVRLYADMGYAGLCVTNHFGGRKEESWETRVEKMHSVYLEALDESNKLGINVFFAWEYSCVHAQDYLTYGLDEQWLYAHPEIQDMTTCEYLEFTRGSGGFVVHAHPFRADKTGTISLRPEFVDAVEVVNTGRSDDVNRFAAQYAENYNLPGFAGSDTHSGNKEKFAGISFATRVADIHDLIARFKNGEGELFSEC